jgi:hypothetical protein
MRTLALALALAALPSVVLADTDTAYKALRIFGKKLGDQQLNRVVEVRGRTGTPQPQVWKIIAGDLSARGGIVEAEVQRGVIISQRTPTARPGGGAPLDLNQLNLDSDGAFTVANQEMQKRNAPFDRIDYVLRSTGPGRPPVWYLDLFDGPNGKIASFTIAADSGGLLEQNIGPVHNPTNNSIDEDRAYVSNANHGSDQADDSRWSKPGEKFRSVPDFFHRLGKRMERHGEQLKRFFSGE